MTIGASLFLIAVGAILRYAVSDAIDGVDLTTIGLILMIVGAVGLLIGLWQTARWSRRDDRYPADPAYRGDPPPPPADRRY